jgi:hypothetical protein
MDVFWTICLDRPPMEILQIAASQVAKIIDVSHRCLAVSCCFPFWFCLFVCLFWFFCRAQGLMLASRCSTWFTLQPCVALVIFKIESLKPFAPLTSNCHPPELCLLSS